MATNEISNIIVIVDSEGLRCYPMTTGECVTVKFGAGEVKEDINLDELLNKIFTRVTTDILPEDNVTADIGSSTKKFSYIYAKKLLVEEVEASIIKGTTKIQGKAIVADEQVQINGITLTKNSSSGRLSPSVGVEGAVWN